MKRIGLHTLALVACGWMVIACRPAQKDPPLFMNDARENAKVDALEIVPESPLHAIGAPTLWKKTTGMTAQGKRVRIAVIGTGVDYTIPDIREALWINAGEFGANATNTLDDDENNYADDVVGFDFLMGDATPYDWNGFDTYTTSIIAATARNNPEVVGVAPNAEIMALRYLSSDGRGNGMDASLAVRYAAANGAKIIYMNWPQGGFSKDQGLDLIVSEIKALADKNILIVLPAGNSANQEVCPFIKSLAGQENILIVAGLTADGKLQSASNYGKGLTEIAAPGEGAKAYLAGHRVSDHLKSTAVAAAYVAGAAALISTLPGMGSMTSVKEALLDKVEVARGGEPLDVLSEGSLQLSGF